MREAARRNQELIPATWIKNQKTKDFNYPVTSQFYHGGALLCPPAEKILPRVRFALDRLESAQQTRLHHWCLPLHITAFSLRCNIPLGAGAGHRLVIWKLRVEQERIFRGIQLLSRYSGPQQQRETAAPPETALGRIFLALSNVKVRWNLSKIPQQKL